MELPQNRFKAALKEGRQQLGLWSGLRSTVTTEIFATCGFDFLVVDMEHGPNEVADVQMQLQVIAGYPNVSALVRPPWNDPVAIKRVLDVGAQTLVIPYVQTVEEATRAVAAMRYPTDGFRGVAGIGRAARYGAVDDYLRRANDEMCLFVQLESVEALRELERIAAVPGVDGIFIGPADLSASMGYLGQMRAEPVLEAIRGAFERARKAGTRSGFLTTPQDAQQYVDIGVDMLAVASDVALVSNAGRDLARRFGRS